MSRGQSAVEYLMTYGWMLLVVAIVGGAIFATVNDENELDSEFNESLTTMEAASGMESCSAVTEETTGYRLDGEATSSVEYDCCTEVERGNSTIQYCQQYKSLVKNGSFAETYQLTR